MAKRKSSRSTGLGLGLDALIKSKTNPVEEREDDLLVDSDQKPPVSNPPEEIKTEKPKKSHKKTKTQSKSTKSKKSRKVSAGSSPETPKKTPGIDSQVSSVESQRVEAVLGEVRKNPRISLWSARSAAVLRYLKKTQPEFSISNEASKLIEEAVKEKYPDIWAIFDDI